MDNIDQPGIQEILGVLKGFYATIKNCSACVRFVFVTGVSKFSHVSMFSGFNNLRDISMHSDYATLLGYTQEELETYFADPIHEACIANNVPRDEMLSNIKAWYDGYRFHAKALPVYNPVTLAFFFTSNFQFDNYWFSTGTPTFLIKMLASTNYDIFQKISKPVPRMSFDALEINRLDPLTLLVQTGYLTIKDAIVENLQTYYTLDFPNFEVRNSFQIRLLNDYTGLSTQDIGMTALYLRRSLESGDYNQFFDLLKTFYASIGYNVGSNVEGRYQLLFVAALTLVGFKVDAEYCTNEGRIDACLAIPQRVCIFEFKLNQTAKAGLKQIMDKEYFTRYLHAGKKIDLISVNFDSQKRQIGDWKVETMNLNKNP